RITGTQEVDAMTLFNVPDVRIKRGTGELQASGPGRVVAVRRGFNGELSFVRSDQGQPTAPSDSQLTYLQVDYQRQIRGNLDRQVVEFSNRVEVIYGPVQSWNETIRQDAPLRKTDALLSCDRLTLAEGMRTTENKRTIDLLAQGNTVVEAKLFTAYGDRLSYEQSKDQLVLEGTGNSDATLVYHSRVGAPQSKQVARKFMYWPKSHSLAIDNGLITDLNDLQGFGR
ncbi:MAG: hypothetical protein KDA92_16875, partial [Planctomycetales bacterium]|nr:hypothetical protein [Planctomycetales bacterium]